jgi:hypothetical protein
MPGGPAGCDDHEIGPVAVLGDRYDLHVVCPDVAQNLLDFLQIQKASGGVRRGGAEVEA